MGTRSIQQAIPGDPRECRQDGSRQREAALPGLNSHTTGFAATSRRDALAPVDSAALSRPRPAPRLTSRDPSTPPTSKPWVTEDGTAPFRSSPNSVRLPSPATKPQAPCGDAGERAHPLPFPATGHGTKAQPGLPYRLRAESLTSRLESHEPSTSSPQLFCLPAQQP